MAIDKAGDDRRRTRVRAGAQRRTPEGKLFCFARNARSAGEKSLTAGVAAKAIEAKPVSGRIGHLRGKARPGAEQHSEKEKTWLSGRASKEASDFR
jgi:hypothetical protein